MERRWRQRAPAQFPGLDRPWQELGCRRARRGVRPASPFSADLPPEWPDPAHKPRPPKGGCRERCKGLSLGTSGLALRCLGRRRSIGLAGLYGMHRGAAGGHEVAVGGPLHIFGLHLIQIVQCRE